MIFIIGAGGGGSILAPIMTRLVGPANVVVVDGDKLEKKNLDRQLFEPEEIGQYKAEALTRRLKCGFLNEWYSPDAIGHTPFDWIMCCVDNHPGRRKVLDACDQYDCQAIVAGNEIHSSEAYVYYSSWKGNPHLDPRLYYPEIVSDQSNDPARAAIGCTGEAQKKNRQLVTANFMAVALASHLYVLWAMESRKAEAATLPYLPTRLFNNLTRNGCVLRGEIKS